ncbi:hypothetical protein [uncultured Lentibacter sp.]|uniref:hypothetical protein n=1 Tax=uncultured Lentibacter sp. TaxID=1659309 RepID=UPI002636ED81|nr:hypothetical protein [uncultured Lentibacter sp.]
MPEETAQLRAAAKGALAAEWLAPSKARVAGLLGDAPEACAQLRAAAHVRPFERVVVFARDTQAAARCAAQIGAELGLDGEIMTNAMALVGSCDFVVGAPAELRADWLHRGLHVTLVGDAGEIDPQVLERVDLLVGEAGVALDDVIGGAAGGRRGEADITLCDLSGAGEQALIPSAKVARMMGEMAAKIGQ